MLNRVQLQTKKMLPPSIFKSVTINFLFILKFQGLHLFTLKLQQMGYQCVQSFSQGKNAMRVIRISQNRFKSILISQSCHLSLLLANHIYLNQWAVLIGILMVKLINCHLKTGFKL